MNVSIRNIFSTGSFMLFILLCSCSSRHSIKVQLQPYTGIEARLCDTIADALRKTYQAEVFLCQSLSLPSQAFVTTKAPRYRADSLIHFLSKSKADSIDYIMGLTHHDISFTKRNRDGSIKKPESTYSDWGIFGLGYMPGNSCMISSYRLHHPDEKVFIARLKKVAIHELGHNLGLPHCTSKACVMQDAVESIQTIDRANEGMCIICKNRIE